MPLSRLPCPNDFELRVKKLDADTPSAAQQQHTDEEANNIKVEEERTTI